jgi:N-acetylmuramoyl-L-alanine amidase
MQLIRLGAHGEDVRDVQHRLLGEGLRVDGDELDGTFGASTHDAVREFQRRRGLPVDGIVGPDTWSQLVEAGYRLGDRTLYLRSPAFRGDDVGELQRMLNALGFDAGKEDGIFGSSVATAVRDFQRNSGAKVDGIVGLDTVRSLQGMRPAFDATGRAMVREGEAARLARTLAGSLVAIDPAYGGSERGLEVNGLVESELMVAVAGALADEISARGGRALVLRRPDEDPDVGDRARRANAADATVCISLHLGGGALAERGAVSCYFGSPRTHSPIGRHLAESLHRALLDLGVPDGGVQPLTISILRDTRMPAAQLELGVVTNADEAAAIADPAFPPRVASAITDGLVRFLEGASDRARRDELNDSLATS